MSGNYNALPNGTGRDVFIVRDVYRIHGKSYEGPIPEFEKLQLVNSFWRKHETREAREAKLARERENGNDAGTIQDELQYTKFAPIAGYQGHTMRKEQGHPIPSWEDEEGGGYVFEKPDKKGCKYTLHDPAGIADTAATTDLDMGTTPQDDFRSSLFIDSMKVRKKVKDMFWKATNEAEKLMSTTTLGTRPPRSVSRVRNKEATLDIVQSHHIPGYMGHVPRCVDKHDVS